MAQDRLVVEHLSKRFGDGETAVTAVNDVSFAVKPGEIVLIMGPSGSGKTTLLLMLGALLRPTQGSIRFDDQVLSDLRENRLPDIRLRQVGFIFQDFNLLSALTAVENVALVAKLAGVKAGQAQFRAAGILKTLGLGNRLDFLAEELSGGEKQRVSIARALVNDPALILADEPTANLDSKNGHELMRRLQEIARDKGISVVIVSHDQRIRDIADSVLWLEDGELKQLAGMAVDPVCRMAVEQDTAVTGQVNGTTYYFC
jgi:putative ABC transport system ATP-binding protein